MLGVYLSGLKSFISERFGADVWESSVPETLENQVQYGKPGSTFDFELFSILTPVAEQVDVPVSELLKMFGRYIFPRLLDFMPEAREQDMSFRSFMISVDRVVHKDVQRLYPDVRVPKIEFIQQANKLTMFYRSERKLCYLAEGLIIGAADFFQEQIELRHLMCMHHGADYCEIEIIIQ
ncbi:heme NO-binding domain-containing protein [Litoribrevibacter albus]|uniref:Guanylate cyclase n=1 Tax=Litoribrevibacter albus TaxID=1473156 RepID=A0AA37W6M6_9GAMM|nr:heme NO-binding domain-containing protein [Litoribrevibacter albus]GLQ30134.1 guanylate cyclase [Litoribrevibacter albus]